MALSQRREAKQREGCEEVGQTNWGLSEVEWIRE